MPLPTRWMQQKSNWKLRLHLRHFRHSNSQSNNKLKTWCAACKRSSACWWNNSNCLDNKRPRRLTKKLNKLPMRQRPTIQSRSKSFCCSNTSSSRCSSSRFKCNWNNCSKFSSKDLQVLRRHRADPHRAGWRPEPTGTRPNCKRPVTMQQRRHNPLARCQNSHRLHLVNHRPSHAILGDLLRPTTVKHPACSSSRATIRQLENLAFPSNRSWWTTCWIY